MELEDLTSALGSSLKIETEGTILSFAKQNNKWNKTEDGEFCLSVDNNGAIHPLQIKTEIDSYIVFSW